LVQILQNTAIIIAWDDPDGWYDHVVPPVVQRSNTAVDFHCGNGNPAPGDSYARCGLGRRQPPMVISPWARTHYVDHAVTEQASILAFIERNWDLGYIDGPIAPPAGTGSVDRYAGSLEGMFDFERRPNVRPLILDPIKGTVVDGDHADLDD
jgi:phospholipase C